MGLSVSPESSDRSLMLSAGSNRSCYTLSVSEKSQQSRLAYASSNSVIVDDALATDNVTSSFQRSRSRRFIVTSFPSPVKATVCHWLHETLILENCAPSLLSCGASDGSAKIVLIPNHKDIDCSPKLAQILNDDSSAASDSTTTYKEFPIEKPSNQCSAVQCIDSLVISSFSWLIALGYMGGAASLKESAPGAPSGEPFGGSLGSIAIWNVLLISSMSDDSDQQLETPSKHTLKLSCIQKITLDRWTPLSLSFYDLSRQLACCSDGKAEQKNDSLILLAASGSCKNITIFSDYAPDEDVVRKQGEPERKKLFNQCATLSGHEDWVRALKLVFSESMGILLLSAGQDKRIRIWRLCETDSDVHNSETGDYIIKTSAQTEAKSDIESRDQEFALTDTDLFYQVPLKDINFNGKRLTFQFEYMLIEHDDWVFGVDWQPETEQILSVSADSSVILWSFDKKNKTWFSENRFGELSSTKGSISATGSAGAFFSAKFWGDTRIIVSTSAGSLRVWNRSSTQERSWYETVPYSGHLRHVKGLAWEPRKRFFLTAGHDMTVRVWTCYSDGYWHEVSRAQIHGYDVNDIAMIDAFTFVSAAEEKALRIFKCPDQIRQRLLAAGVKFTQEELGLELPSIAHVPLLGLSNKSDEIENNESTHVERSYQVLDPTNPPTEEELQRNTLWPEMEKLYGHGYELMAVAASADGRYIASSCKSSSAEFAALRVHDAETGRQIGNPLVAHNSTVCRIQFSDDSRFIATASKDRRFGIFEKSKENDEYQLRQLCAAHSRIVWDVAFAHGTPEGLYYLATASRDKKIKIWILDCRDARKTGTDEENDKSSFKCVFELQPTDTAATSVTFLDRYQAHNGPLWMACGFENGQVLLCALQCDEQIELVGKKWLSKIK